MSAAIAVAAYALGLVCGWLAHRGRLLEAARVTGDGIIRTAATLRVYAERFREGDWPEDRRRKFADSLDGMAKVLDIAGKNLGGSHD